MSARAQGAAADIGMPSSLIESLDQVAAAVSSAMSVADVLGIVVDHAKRITDTDKAVLALADETGCSLDPASMVVRGSRGQHDQRWWELRLNAVGESLFMSGGIHLEPHPEEDAMLLCSPLVVRDRPVGVLAVINSSDRPFTPEQLDFVAVLSAFAASAIETARLSEFSRNVMLSSERERIASEIHDGPVQSLFSVSLGLELCKKQLKGHDPALIERLDELQQQLAASTTDLRRIIYELSPVRLAEQGLVGAISSWLDEIDAVGSLRPKLIVDSDLPTLSRGEQACLYRVAKEAVSNALRHSSARTIEVQLDCADGVVTLEVRDDGVGFGGQHGGAAPKSGIGLPGIRHSVERAGGLFSVSGRESGGTSVLVELPVGGEEK